METVTERIPLPRVAEWWLDMWEWRTAELEAGAGADAAEIRRYCLRDYERMERLQRGDWGYLGIMAEADVVVEGVCQTIHSGGLWGVESDSEESYLREVEGEELAELRGQLRALGFGTRAVGKAMKEVERKED